MKRALLWIGVFVGLALFYTLFAADYGRPSANPVMFPVYGFVQLIWICVGVAWGARGVVRYLRR